MPQGSVLERLLVEIVGDDAQLKSALRDAEHSTDQSAGRINRSLRGIGQGLRDLGSSLPLLIGSGGLAYALQSTAREAQLAEVGMRLFEKQLTLNNQSVSQGTQALKGIADELGLVPQTIADSATQLLRQGLTMQQIVELFRGAGASALAAGRSTASGVDAVTQAVVNQQSIYLNYAGIAQNLNVAYAEMAKQLGKNSTELTTLEKAQAAVNLVQKATAQEVASLPDLLSGYTGATNDLTRALTDAKISFGNFAKDALTPVLHALTAGLDAFNSLPEPVRRAGIVAVTAAGGVTALAVAFGVLETALIPLLGPAGLVVAGVGAVAGLAAALSGGPESLQQSVKDATGALADVKSFSDFSSALDQLGNNLKGPAKDAWKSYRDGIDLTGDSLDQLQNKVRGALDYFTRLQAYQELSGQAAGAVLNAAIPTTGPSFQQQALAAVREGDYARAIDIVKGVRSDLLSVGTLTKREAAEFERLIADLNAAKGAAVATAGAGGGGGGAAAGGQGTPKGTSGDPVHVTVAAPSVAAIVNTAWASTHQADAAALARAKGETLGVPGVRFLESPAEAAVRGVSIFDQQLRDATVAIRQFDDELGRARPIPTPAAVATAGPAVALNRFEPGAAIRSTSVLDELAAEARAAATRERQAMLAAGPALQGGPTGTPVQAAAQEVLDRQQAEAQARTRAAVLGFFHSIVQGYRDAVNKWDTARLRSEMQAQLDQKARDAARLANDIAASAQFAPQRELTTARELSARREEVLTLQTATRGITDFAGQLDDLDEKSREAARATAILTSSQEALIAAAQRPGGLQGGPQQGIFSTQLALGISAPTFPAGARAPGQTAQSEFQQGGLGAVFTPEQTRASDEAAKTQIQAAKDAADRQKQAAEQFRLTVVQAAGGFAQALIAGSPGGIISGGLGAAGSIIGAIPNFGPGALIGTIVGTVGGLLGGIIGGGGGSTLSSENSAAAQAARANATPPALDLKFEFNQTNTLGGIQDPETQAALRRSADDAFRRFEQILAKTIVPRLDRLDRAVGITP